MWAFWWFWALGVTSEDREGPSGFCAAAPLLYIFLISIPTPSTTPLSAHFCCLHACCWRDVIFSACTPAMAWDFLLNMPSFLCKPACAVPAIM